MTSLYFAFSYLNEIGRPPALLIKKKSKIELVPDVLLCYVVPPLYATTVDLLLTSRGK